MSELARPEAYKQIVRPLRFGFCVSPKKPDILRAIQLTTTLWGGMFNPIIPTLTKSSPLWTGALSAKESFGAYVSAFEPDYLVKIGKVRLPINEDSYPHRILDEEAIKRAPNRPLSSFGLSAVHAYRHLHNSEFKYKRHQEIPAYHVEKQRVSLFEAARFGHFPGKKDESREERAFRSFFEPQPKNLEEKTFASLDGLSPLTAGRFGLEYNVPNHVIYLFDDTQPYDCLAYWNLCALGWRVVPIPTSWQGALNEELAARIADWGLSSSDQLTLYSTGSVTRAEKDQTVACIHKSTPALLSTTQIRPRFWLGDRLRRTRVRHCEVATPAEPFSKGQTFDAAGPSFLDSARDPASYPRWASVLERRAFGSSERAARLLPDQPDPRRLLGMFGGHVWTSSEGVVLGVTHG